MSNILFSVLLIFSESLSREAEVSGQTKCLFLNDKPGMIRPTLIDINPVALKYYPFMISLNKCNGSCTIFKNMSCKRNKRHKC